ncbi:hypothetical protein, partial [Corynebacterium sp. MSK150]|uniref:hypothetical protein n=1 Tax=Corynebacterium sp. MSK150 TaxID=3050209 RepID=UPI00254DA549
LSLHTLMVLQPGGCGRVSHRRHQTTTNNFILEQQEGDGKPPSPSFHVLQKQTKPDGTRGVLHTAAFRGR